MCICRSVFLNPFFVGIHFNPFIYFLSYFLHQIFLFFSLPYSKPRVIKILHFVSPFFLRCRVSSTPPQRPHDRRRRPRRSPRPTPTSENPQSSPHRRRLSTVSVFSFFIPIFFLGGAFYSFRSFSYFGIFLFSLLCLDDLFTSSFGIFLFSFFVLIFFYFFWHFLIFVPLF